MILMILLGKRTPCFSVLEAPRRHPYSKASRASLDSCLHFRFGFGSNSFIGFRLRMVVLPRNDASETRCPTTAKTASYPISLATSSILPTTMHPPKEHVFLLFFFPPFCTSNNPKRPITKTHSRSWICLRSLEKLQTIFPKRPLSKVQNKIIIISKTRHSSIILSTPALRRSCSAFSSASSLAICSFLGALWNREPPGSTS